MPSRRILIKELKALGFEEEPGSKHNKFRHPDGRVTVVPRHSDVSMETVCRIRVQIGVRNLLATGRRR